MENFTTFYKTQSHWLKANDLFYPCDKVTSRYKYFCYDLVTARILPAVHWNWQRTAALCWRAERAWIGDCFRSFGRDAWSTTGPSATRAGTLCRLAGTMERECDFSVALQIANDTAQLPPAAAFCNRTSPGIRGYCFEGMGVTAGVLEPSLQQLTQACQATAGRYAVYCFTGGEHGGVPPGALNMPAGPSVFSR